MTAKPEVEINPRDPVFKTQTAYVNALFSWAEEKRRIWTETKEEIATTAGRRQREIISRITRREKQDKGKLVKEQESSLKLKDVAPRKISLGYFTDERFHHKKTWEIKPGASIKFSEREGEFYFFARMQSFGQSKESKINERLESFKKTLEDHYGFEKSRTQVDVERTRALSNVKAAGNNLKFYFENNGTTLAIFVSPNMVILSQSNSLNMLLQEKNPARLLNAFELFAEQMAFVAGLFFDGKLAGSQFTLMPVDIPIEPSVKPIQSRINV